VSAEVSEIVIFLSAKGPIAYAIGAGLIGLAVTAGVLLVKLLRGRDVITTPKKRERDEDTFKGEHSPSSRAVETIEAVIAASLEVVTQSGLDKKEDQACVPNHSRDEKPPTPTLPAP
jgi:hypothetical protein